MSKRPQPDSQSEDFHKHAGAYADNAGDGAGSDEGDSRAPKRSRVKGPTRKAVRKSQDDRLPTLNYKDAGALKELVKIYQQTGPGTLVQVSIPAKNLQPTFSEVKGRHVWGTDIYTDDSDIVCAVMHCGFYNASLKKPVASVDEMKVVVQLLPPQKEYPVFVRNGIRSRAWWGGGTSCSYKVERCCLVSKKGQTLELPPRSDRTHELIPTFTPANSDRVMNTRSREASSERRQRRVQEMTVLYDLSNEPCLKYNMAAIADRGLEPSHWTFYTAEFEMTVLYNLSNEPCLKYNMAAIADRGLKPSQWTSARFQTQVLLVESSRQRYELSIVPGADAENGDAQGEVLYCFARCKQPLTMGLMRRCGLPLPESELDVLEPALQWEQLKWGEEGVDIKDKHYRLVRLHFVDKCTPQTDSPSASLEGMGDTANALLNGLV